MFPQALIRVKKTKEFLTGFPTKYFTTKVLTVFLKILSNNILLPTWRSWSERGPKVHLRRVGAVERLIAVGQGGQGRGAPAGGKGRHDVTAHYDVTAPDDVTAGYDATTVLVFCQ